MRSEALNPKDTRLARLQATIALGLWQDLGELRRTAPEGEPDAEWREAFLMAHLFAGFPRAVEAALVLQRAGGLGSPGPAEVAPEPASAEPAIPAPAGREAGLPLFRTIYAQQTEPVLEILRGAHPAFEEWVLDHAYGRVLSRPGLSAARRELLACAALAALGQDRQLGSHARGAVRCGALPGNVLGVLDAIADLVEPERLARCREVVQRFAKPSPPNG